MNAIELDHVTLARDGRTVLSRIDATVGAGEFVAVLGSNGSGKTTLLHAILGLIAPREGEIRVLGGPPKSAATAIGYLPQKRAAIADLPLRGWDFVASAVKGERWGWPAVGAQDRADVAAALKLVEATALADRAISRLSGGELQRLLLAKALLGRPKLLLLDEPLISLDPRFQFGAVALVRRVQKELGLTVLFTAHDLNPLLDSVDRVLYLGGGGAALGTVDEVVTGPVLSRLCDTPIEVLRIHGGIVVVAAHGELDHEAHRHDAHDA